MVGEVSSTQRNNLREIGLLRKAFGHMHPGDITSQDVYAYMDARKAPVAANREKALLSHIFKKAIRWGATDSNPCRGLESNEENPRRRYIEDGEFWTVHDAAPEMIQVAMKLALLTGLRQGDILALQITNLTNEGLLVTPSKSARSSGKRLLFEWTPELIEVIEQAKGLRGKVRGLWLVCTQRGQRYTSGGFQTAWQKLMRSAIDKGVISERFTFHDIRAKAGSDSEDERLLGHEDVRTLRRHYQRKAVKVTPLKPKILDA